jgi:sugar (pentulose or hexulose) kinase
MQLGAMQASGQGWLLEKADKLLWTPDLLIRFLTGENTAEYTMASVSQFFDFTAGDFSQEILAVFGLRRDLFAPISLPGASAGRITGQLVREEGLSRFEVVSVCEHDTASAFLAAPMGEGSLIISSGTWALMGCELAAPLISHDGFLYNIANEGGFPGHHRFLRNVMGSWIIQEIREYYRSQGKTYSYAELETLAEKAEPFAFFIDVDDDIFFEPGDMPGRIRSYCRERFGKAPDDIGPLLRCVYESLAMKYRRNCEILESVTGKHFPAINVVGGGSRDTLMCRFTAAACGRPVIAGPREATALGNMLVQLIAAGELSSVEEGRILVTASFPSVRYEPEGALRWEEEYHRFSALYAPFGAA